MSDLTSFQSMMQGKAKEGKINEYYYIGHSDLQKYEVTRNAKQNKDPMYDAYLLDRTREIRQNHWTINIGHSDLQKV